MESKPTNKTKRIIELTIYSIISSILYAIAIKCFVNAPGINMVSNGVGGIAIIISRVISSDINIQALWISILTFAINIPIVIMGFRRIGKLYSIFTIFQIIVSALFIYFLPQEIFSFVNIDASRDRLLVSLISGALIGASSGMSLKVGCSTGGIDTLITYIGLKFNKQVGNYSTLINGLILIVGGIVGKDWVAMLYTIVSIVTSSFVIDLIYRRAKKRLCKICTKHKEEVLEEVLKVSKHGLTISKVEGGFDHLEKVVIETIVLEEETKTIINAAKKADPEAFISILNVHQTVGKYNMPIID